MNYVTKESLISAIDNSTNIIELSSNTGSVIISEFGGRPLGIYPKENCYNLLWVNQNIKNVIDAKDRNIGGDRYWISPERDFFYKNPEKWEGWFCQSSLDPANYEILAADDKTCTISTPLSVVNQRTKESYDGEITRQFKIIKDPFNTGIDYVGLEFLDDCVFYEPNLKINGWTLATIISGGPKNPGTVVIPTNPNPKPLSYFRIIPKDRLKIGENYISYKIDVDDIYKLAVRPDDIDFERKAKIGYVLKIPDSDEFGCLIKLSDDIPHSQDECFDVSRDHPNSEIGVVQSYNSESPEKPLLRFGEIELQLSMFKTIDNTSHEKAKHQLLAYIGSKEEIFEVIKKTLGITNPYLF